MSQFGKAQGAPVAIVRGVGDVGSAVAWKLFHAGFSVILHENRQPRTIRRRMAFCDALWEGETTLKGVQALRIEQLDDVLSFAASQKAVALYAGPFDALVSRIKPDLIVDGRIHKFSAPEKIRGRAALTVGIGPMFEAHRHVDVVVESCWGDDIGQIIETGCALEPVPVPPRLAGAGWERFIRSESSGRFETRKDIGDFVTKGMKIGQIGGRNIIAPIEGFIRGLLYSGTSVLKGEKLCEIDPRGQDAHFEGLAERPSLIADGVLSALQSKYF